MDSQAQNPDRPEHLQELEPHLRQAVEEVRTQPAPTGAEEKALEQARTLPQPAAPRRGWIISPAFAFASLTAMLLLGFGVGMWAAPWAFEPYANSARISRETDVALLVDDSRSIVKGHAQGGGKATLETMRFGNYIVDGIQDVSVPGEVRANDPMGIVNAPHSQPIAGRSGSSKEPLQRSREVEYFEKRVAGLVAKQRGGRAMTEQSKKTGAEADKDDPAPVPGKDAPQGQGGGQAPGDDPQGVESYSHFQDNPFLDVLQNPLSTFSSSVDTASFSNVRRFLTQDKRLPPPDAVRVAELVNYFPYTYAQPKGDAPVSFTVDIADCPWQKKHHLLRIAMKGKELSPAEMPPRNFVFLIDTSGSMFVDNRLPLLKKSLAMLTEQLTAKDRVAMVAYAGSAGLVLDSTPGDQKDKILAALGRLEAGGSTNGGDGIRLAYKVALDNFMKDGINRVILGTDGDFNVGTTSEGDLVRLIEEKRKTGVYLTILGYGIGNLKDSTLEKLATHGKGHYAYIDSEAEARKVFVEQGASLVTIAKDVKLQVEFNPQMVYAYRLIGYENRLLRAEDFNNDQKHAGDIGTGHTVTALYEIVPAAKAAPKNEVDPLKYQQKNVLMDVANSGEWLTVKMRYKDPDADTSKLLSQPLAGPAGAFDKMPEDFRFAAAVAAFGQMLRNSEYQGEMAWAAVREVAASSLGKDEQNHRKDFLKMVEAAEKLAPKPQEKK